MAVYTNTYAPPPPPAELPKDIHLHTKPKEYDFNFLFPVRLLKLDTVELRPMVPSLHAELYLDGVRKYPELFKWIAPSPAKTLQEALVFIEKRWRQPSNTLSYAIFTEPPGSTKKVEAEGYVYAGSIALAGCSLLLHSVLDLPPQSGLGLRRCQWLCSSLNQPSRSATLRMGFKHEGVQRARMVVPAGKEGARRGRKGEGVKRGECDARDDWVFGLVWYEWEQGGKEKVDGLMARQE
ncbi:hypothetical protein I350_00027 [Cryptococcus amylolentus CBS 6273]|uniref:N-acetyltransferase domain-containing protein n=1 Tax=Cryptococcus amylolentus CBS 6273 TaxID=1296118 RepID=A0A1E3KG29_9TREE|nr:hypothetical protein I350_00027 [Cryptococcus amylolentus CBS 6273]